jgi:hypothetical protein
MTGLALLAYLGHCETPLSEKYGDTVLRGLTYLINIGMSNNGKLDPQGRREGQALALRARHRHLRPRRGHHLLQATRRQRPEPPGGHPEGRPVHHRQPAQERRLGLRVFRGQRPRRRPLHRRVAGPGAQGLLPHRPRLPQHAQVHEQGARLRRGTPGSSGGFGYTGTARPATPATHPHRRRHALPPDVGQGLLVTGAQPRQVHPQEQQVRLGHRVLRPLRSLLRKPGDDEPRRRRVETTTRTSATNCSTTRTQTAHGRLPEAARRSGLLAPASSATSTTAPASTSSCSRPTTASSPAPAPARNGRPRCPQPACVTPHGPAHQRGRLHLTQGNILPARCYDEPRHIQQ